MLVLSRRIGQSIVISGRITLTVNRVSGNRVTLAFDAPSAIHIRRSELPVFDNETVFDNELDDESSQSLDLLFSSDETGSTCE